VATALESMSPHMPKHPATGAFLLFAYFGNIYPTDYFNGDRSPLIRCSDFVKSLYDTSTLQLTQRFNYSPIEIEDVFRRSSGLPISSADLDF
jgi:hypothetical protein